MSRKFLTPLDMGGNRVTDAADPSGPATQDLATANWVTEAIAAAGGGSSAVQSVSAGSGTVTLDAAAYAAAELTLTGSGVTVALSGATSGTEAGIVLYVVQGSGGPYTLTWPAVTWAGGAAPALPAGTSIFTFTSPDGGTTWYGAMAGGLSLPLTVPNGGTGGSSLTAYQPLAGGTSITSPVQSVLAAAAGMFLGGNGSSALPAWAGLIPPAVVKTSSFTAVLGELNPADASGGSLTATLPGGVFAGQLAGVKMINTAGSDTVTIQPTAPDILGRVTGWTAGSYPASAVLSLPGQGQLLAYNPAGAASSAGVTASSASLTIATSTAPFAAGQLVYFTAGTMPAGLTANTPYYVVSVSGPTAGVFTFQVAATSTGSGIAPTTTGSAVLVQTCGNWTTLADDLPLAQLEALFLQTANNLSDLASASAARTNLGLGSAATQPSSAFDAAGAASAAQSAAEAASLAVANNLSDVGTRQTALNNLAGAVTAAEFLRGNGTNVGMSAIQAADLPAATTSAQGAVELDGTATDIQPTGTQAAGSSGKAADAKHVHFSSGQYLCTPTQYAPSSQTALTNSTTTLAAVSSANVSTGSFTAPASGSVIVTVSAVFQNSSTSSFNVFGLGAHGSVTPVCDNNISEYLSGGKPIAQTMTFLVTGLTPGSSYDFDLLFAASSGTITVYAYGTTSTTAGSTPGAPVTMTVQGV